MYYSSIKSVDVQLEEISFKKETHLSISCLYRIVIRINFPSRTDNSQTNT